jgi:LAGLIDADG endonuclease
MLESPWMLRYSLSNGDCVREPNMIDAGSSDKSSAADNQQERLIKIGWITGFVDGEGCFSVHFVRQPERANRKGYKTGFQVVHGFVVTQGAKSAECLYTLKNFFGVGRVYVNRRHDNHKEDLFQYIVVKRIDLLQTIIPFFQQNPLRTSKESDFLKFVKCMRLIEVNAHLTVGGLLEIAEITQTMNHCKPRTEMIRILRDYTPNTDRLSVKI